MELVFWLCISAVVYTYIGYAVVLHLLSGTLGAVSDSLYVLRKNERRVAVQADDSQLPSLAVVISAYNEESCIEQRVTNLMAQDYPLGRYRILIGSDGSTDGTNGILEAFSDPRLQVFLFEPNRGKATVLNDLLENVSEGIVVFSDANTDFEAGALRNLARHFVDEDVGAVCGELQLHNAGKVASANQDSAYWKVERVLKFHEARLGGLLGANGGIYAIRKELYQALPSDTLIDDFMIVMRVAMQGYRVCYDPAAVAREETSPDVGSEFRRRVRIGTGNYQAFFRLPGLFHPRHGWLTFTYVSHKVLRWFVPHLAIGALLANCFLLSQPFYLITFALQIAVYFCLSLLVWLKVLDRMPAPVRAAGFLFLMNMAFMVGFVRLFSRDSKGTWARTVR
ncbi:glycosyltransferase family 2 protein [Haliea sp. E1-2-M8]|uniref:glycosyltransferase family 2 protein n=1 Tax=Haliea sp. E1-2-M8 TaxID=3064706 RepID=UPI0027170294|nr:glycosyltransferase family 2 protein [Haliea sp. E1-2-M8]MDO8860422.1 glycosyltransferase family 2 protein [Haliea sp. E1-2-M8]